MMNAQRHLFRSVVPALVVGSCCLLLPHRFQAQASPPNLRHDIDAGNQEWIDGLKKGDASLTAASYADDALNCGPTGSCDRGKAAIVVHYRDVISRMGKAAGGRVHSESLYVDHDLAYECGYAEADFPGHDPLKGRFSTVWKRQADGHWKIFRNMSLPDIPEDEP